MVRPASSVLLVLMVASLAACAPAGGPVSSGAGSSESAQPGPQRTLVIALRGEPPSLAAKPVVAFTNALRPPLNLFNAQLDFTDEREVIFPYLAQAVPQLNTDTWRLLPDGGMETTYRLKPNSAGRTVRPSWPRISPSRGASTPRRSSVWRRARRSASCKRWSRRIRAPSSIRWKQPYADADSLRDDFQALPRHILQEPFQSMDPVAFSALPFWGHEYVGLGAYKLEHWEPGAYLEATALTASSWGNRRSTACGSCSSPIPTPPWPTSSPAKPTTSASSSSTKITR